MEHIKPIFEAIDLIFKVVFAVIAFLLFGIENDRLNLDEKRLNIQEKQQTSNLVVAEKIITLLFEEKNKCIAEDQAFLIDFLIDNNNEYNQIKINKQDFYRASAARRNCFSGSIAQDGKVSASLNQGTVPVLTSKDIKKTHEALENKGVSVEQPQDGIDVPSGYLSVGTFSTSEKSFRNFEVPVASVNAQGSIDANTIIHPRWSVYLRANTSNTEAGENAILGVVNEKTCVKVLKSYPNLRGQTWAAVKLVDCQ